MTSSRFPTVFLALGLMLALTARAAESPSTLIPQLEPLRAFIGKTWRGEFKNSTPEKPVVDVARWERALNGRAIRILHSINRGSYGGETVVTWDAARKSIVYRYFTTAGFVTEGTMTVADRRIVSVEKVQGDADGVTEVRATSELLSDGGLSVRSEYLKQGKWVDGHAAVYREDPNAEVVFQ